MSRKTMKMLLCTVMSVLLLACVLPACGEEIEWDVKSVQTPYEVDLDGDGELETVAVMDVLHEDGEACMGIEVKKGGKRVHVETDIIVQEALYLVDLDCDGLPELLFTGDECSDDYVTYCWKFIDGKLITIPFETGDKLDGGVMTAHMGGFECFSTVNALGTYTGFRDLYFDGAMLAYVQDDWLIGTDSYTPELVLKQDIYVLTGMGDEGDFGEETLLEAGTHIFLDCTDGRTWVSFRAENGEEGIILLEENDWGSPTNVNGMPEEEVFEGIEYAD